MHFEAELTNPKPTGIIHTTGDFGPWQVSDPGESPLAGDYTFDHADLGDFKGIAGILSSTGNYEGTLRDIIVDGQTDTPDFSLSHFGNTMDLQTQLSRHRRWHQWRYVARSRQRHAGSLPYHRQGPGGPGALRLTPRFAAQHRARHQP